MKVFYSASTGGFYPDEINYPDIPGDVKEITSELWLQLLNGQADGKVIMPDENGVPVLFSPVVYYVAIAEEQRNSMINTALSSISVIQLKLQAGRTLTDSERNKLNVALDYIDAVDAVDTSTAPDITWPTPPSA